MYFPSIRLDVGECIEDVGEFVCRQVLGLMVSAIDCLQKVSNDSLEVRFGKIVTQFTKYETAR